MASTAHGCLHHIDLTAHDLERSTRFHDDVLPDFSRYEPGPRAVFFTDPDGLKLEDVHTPSVAAMRGAA